LSAFNAYRQVAIARRGHRPYCTAQGHQLRCAKVSCSISRQQVKPAAARRHQHVLVAVAVKIPGHNQVGRFGQRIGRGRTQKSSGNIAMHRLDEERWVFRRKGVAIPQQDGQDAAALC